MTLADTIAVAPADDRLFTSNFVFATLATFCNAFGQQNANKPHVGAAVPGD